MGEEETPAAEECEDHPGEENLFCWKCADEIRRDGYRRMRVEALALLDDIRGEVSLMWDVAGKSEEYEEGFQEALYQVKKIIAQERRRLEGVDTDGE